jgi:hypothetical protein
VNDEPGYEADGGPDDKQYDKVAKLMRKAERAGTPEEAETFYAKAQELMTKYMLDEMRLHDKVNGGDGRTESIESEVINFSTTFIKADQRMWAVVAKANNCRTLSRGKDWPRAQRGIILIGRRSDRENVKLLVTSLLLQVSRLSLKAIPDYLTDKRDRGQYRRAFRFGFADEVGTRMLAATAEAARSHSSGDMLPVLAKVSDQVNAYVKENFAVVPGRRVNLDINGQAAGRAAGARADIGSTRVGGAKGALNR